MDTPLRERLLALLRAPHYRPLDASALARALDLQGSERAELRHLLRDGEERGELVRLRRACYKLRDAAPAPLRGRVRALPHGKYLFVPDADGQEALRPLAPEGGLIELPVERHRHHGAMDGDLVLATVRHNAPRAYRRHHRGRPQAADLQAEARIDDILERRAGSWVGLYRPEGGRYGSLIGDGRSCPEHVRLTEPPPPGLLAGMSIAVQPLSYPLAQSEATGRIEEVLGWPEDDGVDMLGVMRRHGLRSDFPAPVLDETEQLPDHVLSNEHSGRDDWSQRCVFTIDPAGARDYDDAISVRRIGSGGWELAVHIADVSHYVRPGSALDREAAQRGNSTYLPDRVLPMLPPRLCDGICSLVQGEERLTKLCLMRLDSAGNITHTDFRDALIRSRRRLSYPQALDILEGRGSSGDSEVDTMLRDARELAELLRARRLKAGALDLELPQIELELDAHGHPIALHSSRSDAAHRLIEECMLAANEQVARALKAALLPTLYRVHEAPDPAKLRELSHTLRSYGIKAGDLTVRDELRRAMAAIADHPDEQLLSLALLRSMMRARYSPKALGHYGLAKGDYCHFTSPIRRYADLIVHRSLSHLIKRADAPALPSPAALNNLADHISETERNSAAAEQEAERLKLLEYLSEQCSAAEPCRLPAIVTDAWPQGLAVELPELHLKGFISGADLPANTHWYYERHNSCWSSTDGRRILPGSRVELIPLRLDPASGFLELRPAPETTNAPATTEADKPPAAP